MADKTTAPDPEKVTVGKAEAVEPETLTATEDGKVTDAQKAAMEDARLRRENPNKVVYREASDSIGGGNFKYGQPA